MTFCLAIKVKDGLVGIADTRVTSGSEIITARKVSVYQQHNQSIFLMTSGLRSVRDKALTYFDELMEERDEPFTRLFQAVNAWADQIRRVATEDKKAIEESGLQFNIYGLMGGQLAHDKEPRLYMIYPQANWVEIGAGSPYSIIGASGYGKPVLDRTLKYEDTMRFAMKVGCLAFDSTRISAADVDFPLDVVVCPRDTYQIYEHRFEKSDLEPISNWWQDRLRMLVRELPSEWTQTILDKLPDPAIASPPV
ncbi:peptidase [Planctomycetales bacterium ZRK34]|nr:peptidase [Planctomycetales bacterium ZRK34]